MKCRESRGPSVGTLSVVWASWCSGCMSGQRWHTANLNEIWRTALSRPQFITWKLISETIYPCIPRIIISPTNYRPHHRQSANRWTSTQYTRSDKWNNLSAFHIPFNFINDSNCDCIGSWSLEPYSVCGMFNSTLMYLCPYLSILCVQLIVLYYVNTE